MEEKGSAVRVKEASAMINHHNKRQYTLKT